MKIIRDEDLQEFNDIIVELPAFRDLKSKDNIKNVLDIFMREIYLNQPKELFDAFNYHLSEKMQDTFFKNYGIDDDYSDDLMGYVKPDIAYSLEKLFQNKGSNTIFKLLANLLESVFPRINFYNIEVQKSIADTESGYKFKYALRPLYIQEASLLLTEPEVDVTKSRKYLMDLKNFEEYTIWPVPTNYVYIQFNVGTELINNFNTFLHGVRSYGSTYLTGQEFNYLSQSGAVEKIDAGDMELLIAFFQLNLLQIKNPGWDDAPSGEGSSLSVFESGSFDQLEGEGDEEYQVRIANQREKKCSFMYETATLFRDYQAADYSKREEMENLRRRWQFFLRLQENSKVCYSSIQELNQKIKDRYPRLYEDYWANANMSSMGDNEGICDFFIKMYSVFLNGARSSFVQPENSKCFLDIRQEKPIESYTWRDSSGTILSWNPTLRYKPKEVGATTLTLSVEGEDGFIDTDTITILTTAEGDSGPTIKISQDFLWTIDEQFHIGAELTANEGLTIVAWDWILDDKVISSQLDERPNYTPMKNKKISLDASFGKSGDYVFKVKATDSNGNINYNAMTLRVIKGPTPDITYPQADAGPNLHIVLGDKTIIEGKGQNIEFVKLHDTDWILTYIDVAFGGLFLNDRFITHFFQPIMDLFEKYFFPVEVEYLADLTNREKIKDKWNAVGTQERINPQVIARHTSIQTPIRGLDQQFFFLIVGNRQSRVFNKDMIKIHDWSPTPWTPCPENCNTNYIVNKR